MADDSDNLGPLLDDLAKYGIGTAGTLGANAATQAAYQAAIKNLRDRFGDYDKLQTPAYKNVTPDKLGPSALGNIQNDAQSRLDQQNAEAQLQDIASRGGLDLGDRAALNNLEQTLSRNNSARQNSTANQYAARGQLGSGAQLSMDLANQQNAAQNANQHGEDIAAQAQKRAVQAIIDKAGIARSMSSDQYARDKAAAEAADSIARYNASMGTDAQKYNNGLLSDAYGNQLKKLQGETGLTDSLNNALLGSGKQQANTIAGAAYGGAGLVNAASAAAKAAGKGGSGGGSSGSNDPGLDSGGQADANGNRGGPADLSGGATGDATDTSADTIGTSYGASDPAEWESLAGDFA